MTEEKTLNEILTITMEECGEVIQACSKIIRFGEDSEYEGRIAKDVLEKELGDLQCMIELLHEFDVVSYHHMDNYSLNKREKLKHWSNIDGL